MKPILSALAIFSSILLVMGFFPSLAKSSDEVPKADEEGRKNIALQGEPNASSIIGAAPDLLKIEFLNEGWYNKDLHSWVPEGGPPAWAEIHLGKVFLIDKVVISSENTETFNDRHPKDFRILVATEYNEDSDAETWRAVHEAKEDVIKGPKAFTFDPQKAQWVRIHIMATDDGTGPRIDEIEIYESLSATVIRPMGKLATIWGAMKIR